MTMPMHKLFVYLYLAFVTLFFSAIFQPAHAQQITCRVGTYCCGRNNPTICGWITFKAETPDVLYACDNQAGTVNCRVFPEGADFNCPAEGTGCIEARFCSTQTPGAIVQQCADGACGAKEFVREQCNPNTCQAGKCASPGGQIIVPVDPNAEAYYSPDLMTMTIHASLAVITLAILFSVIGKEF